MIYLEYNKENIKRETFLECTKTFSRPSEEWKYIPITYVDELKPNNNMFPGDNRHIISGQWGFNSPFNIDNGKFYTKLDNYYLLFETNLRKYDRLTISSVGNVDKIKQYHNYYEKMILPIFDTMELSQSGLETTFSSIKTDFIGETLDDLPHTLQEVRIWEGDVEYQSDLENCKLLFTGFIDTYTIPEFKTGNEERYLEFSLISPMTYTTKKHVSVNGNYKIKDLLNIVLKPLIDDGFTLKEVNINNDYTSVNYYFETVETVMNYLASKLNFYWYIDKNKNIYVEEINALFGKQPIIEMVQERPTKGLYELKATVRNNDYFNTLIAKNARVYTHVSQYDPKGELINTLSIKSGDSIDFNYPIDINPNNLKKIFNEYGITEKSSFIESYFKAEIGYDPFFHATYDPFFHATYDPNTNKVSFVFEKYESGGRVWLDDLKIGFNDDTDTSKLNITLQRDSFFSNLITGFKWDLKDDGGNDVDLKLSHFETISCLKNKIYKVSNEEEIEKSKVVISDSGVVEKIIDLNEKWFTDKELKDYCESLMSINQNETTEITASFDEDYEFEVGQIIYVSYPNFFIEGDFIITDVITSMYGTEKTVTINAKNYNLTENYIDLFRKEATEEAEEKNIDIVEYEI